jgi:hypothetical protein
MTSRTISYLASGGASELRHYKAGEGSTIEQQQGGATVVAWSAAVPASTFMRSVSELFEMPASAQAELAPALNGRKAIPFEEAQKAVECEPDRFSFIAVDADRDSSFTWEATDPAGEAGSYPDVPGEVGIVLRDFNQAWIERLIEATATPHVRKDVAGIVASIQRLTDQSPPASA